MPDYTARRALTLIWLTACLAPVVQAAALIVEPAGVPNGKVTSIHISAPGPGEVMLVPGGPHLTASLPLPNNHILGLDPRRGLAYRVAHDTLEVLDLRAPGDTLGRYRADAPIAGLQRHAGDVLLRLDDGQVLGLDLSDPRLPKLGWRFTLPEAGAGVAIAGQYALQATGREELLIWDIGDPARARLAVRYPTRGATHDVAVSEGRAYVAQHDAGLLILDVQEAAHPLWLGSTGQLGNAVKVAARGDSVWVASDDGAVSRVDVFNAAQPSFSAKQVLSEPRIQALAVAGDEAWVATPNAISLIGFDAEPPQISNAGLDVGRGVNFGGQRRADVVGDRVYVADWFSGLHIYDVGDPRQPRLLSSLRTPGSAKGVAVRGDYAYVADDDHGLQVVDIGDPGRPRIVANLATPGLAYTPKLAGDLLYLASHRGGFQIIDVRQPTAPKLIADVATPGMAWSLAISGNTLYVADDAAGLLIYDVSDPAQPRAVGAYDSGGRLEEVLVRGGIAYLAYFDQGLKLADVSAPAAPRVLAELATPGNARGLDLHGDDLYLADWLAGVHVVNVADPARPVVKYSYDTPGAAWGIRAGGDGRAYVLDWWGGFAVLNPRDRAEPDLVRYAERGTPRQDAAQGDYLYVAHGAGGLQIFDIKNPLNPTWVTGVELPAAALSVAVGGDAAYVGLAEGGIAVIELSQPIEARLVTRLRTDHEVDTLRADGARLYALAGGRGLVFDLAQPLQPRLTGSTADKVGEPWPQGGQVYVGYGAEAWRAAGITALEPPRPAAALRGQGDLLAALDQTRRERLSVYRIGGGKMELLAELDLGRPLLDLAWGEGVLYLATAQGLQTVDLSDPRRPLAVPPQPGMGAGTNLILHRGVLYAGLTALRPSPLLKTALDDQGRAQLTVPANLAIGGYDLLYRPAQGAPHIQPNALKVEMPRFSKPKITPEEFQRLLQQHRNTENPPAGSP